MSESILKHQATAERIRQFLVCVRGGALFLSPSDSERLTVWLEDGVSEAAILLAIERAAKARAKKRSKLPLTLGTASRHIGKRSKSFSLPTPSCSSSENKHPLLPVAREIKRQAPSSPLGKKMVLLADELLLLDANKEDVVGEATSLISSLFKDAVKNLPTDHRKALYKRGRDQLGDLNLLVDEAIYTAALEERVLAILWEEHPYLSVATIFEQVSS